MALTKTKRKRTASTDLKDIQIIQLLGMVFKITVKYLT